MKAVLWQLSAFASDKMFLAMLFEWGWDFKAIGFKSPIIAFENHERGCVAYSSWHLR